MLSSTNLQRPTFGTFFPPTSNPEPSVACTPTGTTRLLPQQPDRIALHKLMSSCNVFKILKNQHDFFEAQKESNTTYAHIAARLRKLEKVMIDALKVSSFVYKLSSRPSKWLASERKNRMFHPFIIEPCVLNQILGEPLCDGVTQQQMSLLKKLSLCFTEGTARSSTDFATTDGKTIIASTLDIAHAELDACLTETLTALKKIIVTTQDINASIRFLGEIDRQLKDGARVAYFEARMHSLYLHELIQEDHPSLTSQNTFFYMPLPTIPSDVIDQSPPTHEAIHLAQRIKEIKNEQKCLAKILIAPFDVIQRYNTVLTDSQIHELIMLMSVDSKNSVINIARCRIFGFVEMNLYINDPLMPTIQQFQQLHLKYMRLVTLEQQIRHALQLTFSHHIDNEPLHQASTIECRQQSIMNLLRIPHHHLEFLEQLSTTSSVSMARKHLQLPALPNSTATTAPKQEHPVLQPFLQPNAIYETFNPVEQQIFLRTRTALPSCVIFQDLPLNDTFSYSFCMKLLTTDTSIRSSTLNHNKRSFRSTNTQAQPPSSMKIETNLIKHRLFVEYTRHALGLTLSPRSIGEILERVMQLDTAEFLAFHLWLQNDQSFAMREGHTSIDADTDQTPITLVLTSLLSILPEEAFQSAECLQKSIRQSVLKVIPQAERLCNVHLQKKTDDGHPKEKTSQNGDNTPKKMMPHQGQDDKKFSYFPDRTQWPDLLSANAIETFPFPETLRTLLLLVTLQCASLMRIYRADAGDIPETYHGQILQFLQFPDLLKQNFTPPYVEDESVYRKFALEQYTNIYALLLNSDIEIPSPDALIAMLNKETVAHPISCGNPFLPYEKSVIYVDTCFYQTASPPHRRALSLKKIQTDLPFIEEDQELQQIAQNLVYQQQEARDYHKKLFIALSKKNMSTQSVKKHAKKMQELCHQLNTTIHELKNHVETYYQIITGQFLEQQKHYESSIHTAKINSLAHSSSTTSKGKDYRHLPAITHVKLAIREQMHIFHSIKHARPVQWSVQHEKLSTTITQFALDD